MFFRLKEHFYHNSIESCYFWHIAFIFFKIHLLPTKILFFSINKKKLLRRRATESLSWKLLTMLAELLEPTYKDNGVNLSKEVIAVCCARNEP